MKYKITKEGIYLKLYVEDSLIEWSIVELQSADKENAKEILMEAARLHNNNYIVEEFEL